MKVTLDYDKSTGELTDNGTYVSNIGTGFIFSELAKQGTSTTTKDLTPLKDAGFTAQEIMQMKREGLV